MWIVRKPGKILPSGYINILWSNVFKGFLLHSQSTSASLEDISLQTWVRILLGSGFLQKFPLCRLFQPFVLLSFSLFTL